MTYTVFRQPGCTRCKEIIYRLFATGAVVEVLDEADLAAMEDIDRRNTLMAQIHERVRTDLPVIFENDQQVEWDEIAVRL